MADNLKLKSLLPKKESIDVPPPAIVRHAQPAQNPGVKVDFSARKPSIIDKIADAIYHIEGGSKTKFPYGIKSINTRGNIDTARNICINTIKNNYKKWVDGGKKGKYFDFLADKYCPISSDKQGNINWKHNIKKLTGMDI